MKLNELAIIGVAATTVVSCTPAKTEYASYELYPVRSGSLTEMEYTPAATQFTLWAPTADEVRLMLFEAGDGGHSRVLRQVRRQAPAASRRRALRSRSAARIKNIPNRGMTASSRVMPRLFIAPMYRSFFLFHRAPIAPSHALPAIHPRTPSG